MSGKTNNQTKKQDTQTEEQADKTQYKHTNKRMEAETERFCVTRWTERGLEAMTECFG